MMISKETREYLKEIGEDLWYYSSLSFSMDIAIMIGTGLGYWIDKTWETTPIWTLVGIVLGTAAGFRNLYIAMKRAGRTKNER